MRRLQILMQAFTLSVGGAVFAQAQTTPPPIAMAPAAAIDAPLEGVSEVIDELRSVSYHRADGRRSFAVVGEDFSKYFPSAVTEGPAGSAIEPGAMAAILLALVKEISESNAHLSSQIEHVISDRAELERRVHALEAELVDMRGELMQQRLQVADGARGRRRKSGSARQ